MIGWAPGRVGLYRLFDVDGALLYVGIGQIPEVRWKSHAKRAKWWGDVDLSRATVEWYDSRPEAEEAEIAAIRAEDPVHNVAHSPRYAKPPRPPGKARIPRREDNEIRRFRMSQKMWEAYAEAVGDLGRAGDLRDYLNWRIDHPRTPLPGRRRGPVKRVRVPATE